MSRDKTVLVTGGSGYVGSWCVVELLRQGYSVRTTVRSLAREGAVRAACRRLVDPEDRLRFFEADLSADSGWDAATDGCDYVLHVASPVSAAEPKDPDDLIIPAREGAKRVLAAAVRAGVKRVVLTSSVMATSQNGQARESVSDETIWTDLSDRKLSAYQRSKTVAERAAWDWMATTDGKTTLTTVNPVLVLGPVLSDDYAASVQVVARLLWGQVPGIPRFGFNFVDVRDVADLHIRAMTSPNAAGQRFIAAANFAWMSDIAAILRERLGDAGKNVPTRKIPDFVIRIAGLIDKDLGSLAPSLGKKHDFSSSKAKTMLGWRTRPLEESVVECAKSLLLFAGG